jgi:hypothetical protein
MIGRKSGRFEGRGGRRRVARVEASVLRLVAGAVDVDLQDRAGSCWASSVERAGDLLGDAGAHQHVVDAGQHGAVQRRQVGHLHLGQEVDPHRAVVPLLGQEHLHEEARMVSCSRTARPPAGTSGSRGTARRGRARRAEVLRSTSAPTSGQGKCSIARRMCPPASPSCRRRTIRESTQVPETTPSCPRSETALASTQLDTPTPMPPWMMSGCGAPARGRVSAGRGGGSAGGAAPR